MQSQYEKLGVSSDKKEVHDATKSLNKGLFPNAFVKIFPDILTNNDKYCLIAHADGVGTKVALAYLYWKVTGDVSVFRNIAIDAIVMNSDDLICVGALGPYTFTQNIDRNKNLIPLEVLEAIIEGTDDFFKKMKQLYGIETTYNGGETADVANLVRTITVNASMQARMLRKIVIDTKIIPNTVIVGLASFGQATYENEYNSGIGSNGLTMAIHKLFGSNYRNVYPETYDPAIIENAYTGQYNVLSKTKSQPDVTLGRLALSPTRTYTPIVKDILYKIPESNISAIIHCSGGGQTKCLGFAENVHIVKDNLFPTPEIFSLIQEESKEEWKNMYKTFNMGHRLEIYCEKKVAQEIINISKSFNVDAQVIGRVEECVGKKLTIESPYGTFVY